MSIFRNKPIRVAMFSNTDWYLFNFRLNLIQNLISLGHEVYLISPDTGYAKKFLEQGINWTELPMERRSLNPISEAATIVRIKRVLDTIAPDILHNFTIKCAVYGSLASKMRQSIPVINSLDGLGYVFSSKSLKARFLRPLVISMFKATLRARHSRTIVMNQTDQTFLLQKSIAASEQLRLVPGGVGINTEAFKPVAKKKKEPPVVLFASRLLREKGIEKFIDAAEQINSAGPKARFLVAGEPDPGNPGSVTIDEVNNWVNRGLIEYIGQCDDMPKLLEDTAIIVLASGYGEGIPRILIEGAACGIPLISSYNSGCMEVVENEVNGLLVAPDSVDDLVHALHRLIGNSDERMRFGTAGRENALRKFDEKKVLANTLEIYDQALSTVQTDGRQ